MVEWSHPPALALRSTSRLLMGPDTAPDVPADGAANVRVMFVCARACVCLMLVCV